MKRIILIILILFFMGSVDRFSDAQTMSEHGLQVREDPVKETNDEESQDEQSMVQQPKDEQPKLEQYQPFEGLSRKISFDLRGMDIIDTLKFLSSKGDLNIVATKNVKGRITLFLSDVTIADVLEIILLTNNLACEKKGNIITIMTGEEYEALYGEKYSVKIQSKTVALKYADAKRVGAVLENLKSTVGKVIVDETTATIILIDTPAKIKEMQEAIQQVDLPTVSRVIPTVTETFELKYAKVGEIKEEIAKALTEDIGSIRSDERTNKLVVTDLPHNMDKIRDLIAAFDAKTKQVFIEAKIIEVTLNDDFAMGVEWSKLFAQLDDLTFTGTFPFSSPDSTSSSLAVDVGTLPGDDYEAALEFIKSIGKITILSQPHIAVCNNEEAKFMVGTREAYVTTTTTVGEVTETRAETVNFIDVGINLYVTPTINKDGFVKMHIKPEVSSLGTPLTTSDGNLIPIVHTSNVETDVLVKDGVTIIIAGLIREEVEKSRSKVPLLGDIIPVGFRKTSREIEKKELVIFLTPHIISGEQDQFYAKEKEKE